MNNRKKKKNNSSYIIDGAILIGVTSLLLLIFFGVFDPSGKYVTNFFVGVAGLSVYGLALAGFIIGVLRIVKFDFSLSVTRILQAALIYSLFIMVFHAVTSVNYAEIASGYSSYLSYCYHEADTAGGVIAGLIVYPLVKINYVFALVMLSLLLFAVIAWTLFGGIVKRNSFYSRTVKMRGRKKESDTITHTVISSGLKNENIDGKQLGDIRHKSRFNRKGVNYTPLDDDYDMNFDDGVEVEYKDKFAFDSVSVEEKQDINERETEKSPFDSLKDVEENTFARLRREAHEKRRLSEASEPTSNSVEDDDIEYLRGKNRSVSDSDIASFKESVEKMRNGEDRSIFDGIKYSDDDFEEYYTSTRMKIIEENLQKDMKSKTSVESSKKDSFDDDEDSVIIKNPDESKYTSYSNEYFTRERREAEKKHLLGLDEEEDVIIKDDEVKEANIAAETSSDSDRDNTESDVNDTIIEKESVGSNANYSSEENDGDNTDDEEYVFDFDPAKIFSEAEKSDESDKNVKEPLDEEDVEVVDLSETKEIEDFSDVTDKTYSIKQRSGGIRGLDKFGEGKDTETESLKEVKRRSDFGGTHNTSSDVSVPKKDDAVEPQPKFINPFAQQRMENKAVEEAKPKEVAPKKNEPFISKSKSPYIPPSIDLLKTLDGENREDIEKLNNKREIIEENLKLFNIHAKVKNITVGPTFSRFELAMEPGTGKSVKAITGLSKDITMWLGAKGQVNIQAPIPGRTTIGIEVPNEDRRTVGLKEVFNSKEFNNPKIKIPFALGVDIDNVAHVCDITKMPHLLIAGSTGSGKSVGISALLCSILYKCTPDQVRLILIDPKQVELNDYSALPHMLLKDTISDPTQVINTLNWLIDEMERRYTAFKNMRVAKIEEYNDKVAMQNMPIMPYIVIVIDEVADLMITLKKNLEDRINKLAAKSRASGIHIVLATQRPSVDIITGPIKANLPSRIAFATVQSEDSKTILGQIGAEKLLRYGDMLFMDSSSPVPERIQGAFISKEEVVSITDYVRDHNSSEFDDSIRESIEKEAGEEEIKAAEKPGLKRDSNGPAIDEKFADALQVCITNKTATVSRIQSKLGIGYPRAMKIHDQLESYGYITGNRVNITQEEFDQLFSEDEGSEE